MKVAMDAEDEDWSEHKVEYDGGDLTTAEAMANVGVSKARFSDLSSRLAAERTVQLARGSGGGRMTLDVCFCIDVSGSMKPYLKALIAPGANVLKTIIGAIGKKLRTELPSMAITLRLAGLAFRDLDDAQVFERLPFAQHTEPPTPPSDPEQVRANAVHTMSRVPLMLGVHSTPRNVWPPTQHDS